MPYTIAGSRESSSSRAYLLPLFLIFLSITTSLSILILTRLILVLCRPKPKSLNVLRPSSTRSHPTHLLIVLGSGGHTAEMLSMLRRLPALSMKFTYRTYLMSSGDGFSAWKAKEFELETIARQDKSASVRDLELETESPGQSYDIVTVRRARLVHQSLASTPWSALLCLWDCISVLRRTHSEQSTHKLRHSFEARRPDYPDLILTNGPGTGVCVVLASLILRFCGFSGPSASKSPLQWQHSGQMRTIFIESWARVRTLSLSGKILLPFVDRFLVQWPSLQGRGGGKAEFAGALVA
jgi:beta-1,4-N-acetylglucosaminyltransferase